MNLIVLLVVCANLGEIRFLHDTLRIFFHFFLQFVRNYGCTYISIKYRFRACHLSVNVLAIITIIKPSLPLGSLLQTPWKDIPYCLPEVSQGIFSTSTGFLSMFILEYDKLQLLHNKGWGRAQK